MSEISMKYKLLAQSQLLNKTLLYLKDRTTNSRNTFKNTKEDLKDKMGILRILALI